MIYFDTSALAKKYFKKEKGRKKILDLFDSDNGQLVSSVLTQLEILSAVTRRRREISGFDRVLDAFSSDWEAFLVWTLDEEIISASMQLISRYGLKAVDSIHLATAQNVRSHTRDKVLFVSSDRELLNAAAKEKFTAIDPEAD